MTLMRCPHCRQPLVRTDRPPYLVWTCCLCGGCAATLAVLRKGIRHDALQRAWQRTIGHGRTALLLCPDCAQLMNRVPTEGPEIDLCRQCQLVWFDAGELEAMPQRSAEEIAAAQKTERWARELREFQRRRDAHQEFMLWLMRHPISVPH